MAGMMMGDHTERDHWNRRYAERPWPDDPSLWLVQNADLLTDTGRALDVAGGTGRNALWLAQRGWSVTIADISDVGIAIARQRAEAIDVTLETHLVDLDADALATGPWDLVMLFHYLKRDIFSAIATTLRPGGTLIGALATVTNLERNERPPLPYLLDDGELPDLVGDMELVRYQEGWLDDRHDARFVAHKPT